MKKRNLKKYPDTDDLSTKDVVSSTECTGLMQSLPCEEEGIESISDIYEIPDQGSEKEMKVKSKKSNN